MQESEVLVSQEGAVRILTLHRPAALNSFTTSMLAELRVQFDAAAADARVRCVMLTGAGRGFCAGQDLNDAAIKPDLTPGAQPKDIGKLLVDYYIPLAQRVRSMPIPVIAAVNGVAAGAGANLALGCDLVLAAESSNFIQAFSKIGLLPDCGGTWLLPRLVGRAQAMALTMLGDKLSAADAQAIGLIYRCVPDVELLDEALALAQRLATMPVAALAATRQALDSAMQMDWPTALAQEAALQRRLGFAHDYQEGASAFLQKRKPAFSDR
jgi:2-(1,2-epoxy-1,2-dihydrophenyl)acetyl-CoA isomerase